MDDLSELLVYEDADGRVVHSINSDQAGPFLMEPAHGYWYQLVLPEEGVVDVHFQRGNPASFGINGFTNEAMIQVLVDRIRRQNAKVSCEHNELALEYLHSALEALNARTQDRQDRGVTGQDVA